MFSVITKLSSALRSLPVASFHTLQRISQNIGGLPQVQLLNPVPVTYLPSCGFKQKGHLRRRCRDCYFVRRGERLFVICNTHGRHKQMAMVKDPRNTWILSHATQGKIRPW